MRATWYVMESGEPGDPAMIAPDADGVLRHGDGRAVAIGPHGPRSTGVDLPDESEVERRDLKPETDGDKPKRGYKTRVSKAD